MKTFYKNMQIICFLLSVAFLLQSCHVYLSTPINLDEAVVTEGRIKITTADNKTHKYLWVEKSDSMYYGYTKKNGKVEKVPIEKDKIKNVHQVDKTTSTIATIGTVTAATFLALAAVFAVTCDCIE
ncbi:MAG TPA: hypothetical protein VLB74_00210 [Flavobacterium sp.]|uniref:hypothetical protein n=1 Tax=Flavobacterium sp. TaxID=239 RepID=UPI002C98D539|nr:hypothetical protein [Flavobacterium sp.]HSD13047.1 hypothetical protein [Flavobacterium sp.]